MSDLKILILLFYYKRPKLVLNALRSIKESNYKNYELVFIDDSEQKEGGLGAIRSVFGNIEPYVWNRDLNIKYIWTVDTDLNKLVRGSSVFGSFANTTMQTSDADIVIMLNDDDFLLPEYLEKLNNYYLTNLNTKYSYSHFVLFNPLEELYDNVKVRTEASNYLRHYDPINPFCQVDSSQVSARLPDLNKAGITFNFPQTANLDAAIFAKMFNAWGPCVFNGIVGEAKGWNSCQLGKRQDPYGRTE